MADFNTLVNEVMIITGRSDLTLETQQAVKSATLELHRSDFYAKDLLETVLEFNPVTYIQTVDFRTLFPRYRALKYLRKFDGSVPGVFFKILTPDEILDGYGSQKVNVAYTAGQALNIKSSTELQYVMIGLYQNPVVATADTYSSWIANEAEFAIIYNAAAKMFGTVLGNSAKADENRLNSNVALAQLRNSNLAITGE